nr:Dam family site-specific DNA-(adenine-N6)-methyltransferase [Mesorhizobium sp. LMG17149]
MRWAGSKRQTLRVLKDFVPNSTRHYVEPFAGSAALFFATKPVEGTLADLNGHLINALKQVRRAPRRIHERLNAIPRSEENYYESRHRFNSLSPNGEEAATLFIYLNRNCFNGLWRTNQRGLFNVPFGGDEMGASPPLSLFIECANSLRGKKLLHQDYRRTIKNLDGRHFIYADPPYFTAAERTFVEYGAKSFGMRDLDDLVRLLSQAADRGALVALTYSGAMAIPNIPVDWKQHRFDVTRNVGGFSGTRKKHSEVLYTNIVT